MTHGGISKTLSLAWLSWFDAARAYLWLCFLFTRHREETLFKPSFISDKTLQGCNIIYNLTLGERWNIGCSITNSSGLTQQMGISLDQTWCEAGQQEFAHSSAFRQCHIRCELILETRTQTESSCIRRPCRFLGASAIRYVSFVVL